MSHSDSNNNNNKDAGGRGYNPTSPLICMSHFWLLNDELCGEFYSFSIYFLSAPSTINTFVACISNHFVILSYIDILRIFSIIYVFYLKKYDFALIS